MEAIYSFPTLVLSNKFNQCCIELNGDLYTEDIDNLANSLNETLLGEANKINEIIVDISRADDFSIKARRLFGVCFDFQKKIECGNNGIKFNLIINEKQQVIFQEMINLLNLNTNISLVRDVGARNNAHSTFEKLSLQIKYYIVPLILSIPLLVAFLGGWLFIEEKSIRFVVIFSSGILLYEVYLLFKIYRKSYSENLIKVTKNSKS